VIKDFRVFRCIIKYLDKDNWYSTSILCSRQFLFCIKWSWFDWFDWLLVLRNDFLVNHDYFFCRWFMQIRLDLMLDFLLDWFKITIRNLSADDRQRCSDLNNNKIWEFCIVSE
jgi:hypothetical protein